MRFNFNESGWSVTGAGAGINNVYGVRSPTVAGNLFAAGASGAAPNTRVSRVFSNPPVNRSGLPVKLWTNFDPSLTIGNLALRVYQGPAGLIASLNSPLGPGWQLWNVGTLPSTNGNFSIRAEVINTANPYSFRWIFDDFEIGPNQDCLSSVGFNSVAGRNKFVSPTPSDCGVLKNFSAPGDDWATIGDDYIEFTSAYGFHSAPNAMSFSNHGDFLPGTTLIGVQFPVSPLIVGRQYRIHMWIDGTLAHESTPLIVRVADDMFVEFKSTVIYKHDLSPGLNLVYLGTVIAATDPIFITILLNNSSAYPGGDGVPIQGRWTMDDLSFTYPCATLESSISFSGRGLRSRDNNCLVDYPEDRCGGTSFTEFDDCVDSVFSAESISIQPFTDDDECVDPPLSLENIPPFTVYNLEGDPCPLHDPQTFSYAPPSRGSDLDFAGNLFARLMRPYRSSVSFSGHLTRGRRFPGALSFGSVLGTIKTSSIPLDMLAWYKAISEVSVGDNNNVTGWQDQTAHGHNLTPAGGATNPITSNGVRPKYNSAGTSKGTTNLPTISFEGTLGPEIYGYFTINTGVFDLTKLAGWTIALIVRDYSNLAQPSYHFGIDGENGIDSDDDFIQAIVSGGNSRWETAAGGVAKNYCGLYTHTHGNDVEAVVLRSTAITGVLDSYIDGVHRTGDTRTNSTYRIRFFGRDVISAAQAIGVYGKAWAECIIWNRSLTDPEIAVVNTYLSNRIAGA